MDLMALYTSLLAGHVRARIRGQPSNSFDIEVCKVLLWPSQVFLANVFGFTSASQETKWLFLNNPRDCLVQESLL
jgi:hypothetical protein